MKPPVELMVQIMKDLTDQGLIIEGGWRSLRMMSLPPETPQAQLDEMRTMFFAGAQHLFSSIMNVLEPGTERTDADLDRIGLIEKELKTFIEQYQLTHFPTKGRA